MPTAVTITSAATTRHALPRALMQSIVAITAQNACTFVTSPVSATRHDWIALLW